MGHEGTKNAKARQHPSSYSRNDTAIRRWNAIRLPISLASKTRRFLVTDVVQSEDNWGWLRQLVVIAIGSAVFGILMEVPSLDPTRASRLHTGTVLSSVWCIGLLSWALRATRSNQSRFTVRTLLVITTIVAVGFVNVFVAMAVVCYMMASDLGTTKEMSRKATKWKLIQFVAGCSGIAHAFRVMYHA